MRAKGIDIYQRWQTNYRLQSHHDFIMVKVAEGRAVMPHERIWEQVKDVPVVVAYTYMRSSVSAEEHVDTILGATANATYQPDGYMVDFEKRNNIPSMQFGQIFRDTIALLKHESGKKVIKYSNPSVIQEWLLRYGQRWVLDDHDWVIAQYPFRNDAWDTPQARQFLVDVYDDNMWNPRLPAGFIGWGSWQCSADGNGLGAANGVDSHSVDIQAWNGTKSDLLRYWQVDTDDPVEPAPEDVHIRFDEIQGDYKVTVNIDVEKI